MADNSQNLASQEWSLTTLPDRLKAFFSGAFAPKSELDAATAALTALTTDRDGLKARADKAEADHKLAGDQLTAREAEFKTLQEQNATLSTDKATLTTEKAALQARLDDPKGETAAKAIALVAGQQIPAGALPETKGAAGGDDLATLSAQMNAATDPAERARIYAKIYPPKA